MPTPPERDAEAAAGEPPRDDPPELLKKLEQRRHRHQQRGLPARIGVTVLGVLLVIAGVVLSGPGVPGPGFLVILLGLSFLALEFDRAERWLKRAIVAADRAKARGAAASPRQKALSTLAAVLTIAAFAAAAVRWDIPLLPV